MMTKYNELKTAFATWDERAPVGKNSTEWGLFTLQSYIY
jgi:hypothetical protein